MYRDRSCHFYTSDKVVIVRKGKVEPLTIEDDVTSPDNLKRVKL